MRTLAPLVKSIIPVASGKGGVGKSTVSANLALALAHAGARVGLMDADVYGPSIPTILGITEKPITENNRILPVQKYGLKIISMGFFVPTNEAVIWRGPMLHKMVQDFLGVVDWGELDYLIVDLPPGTGDIQLSLCQSIPVTGAVIVSTPQDVAWNVAQKAIVMFDKLNAPILGIIENMSHFVCNHCGQPEEIFGKGGAHKAALQLEIPYLGEIPIVTQIRQTADEGDPTVHKNPNSAEAKNFMKIAANLVAQIHELPVSGTKKIIPQKVNQPNPSIIEIAWSDGQIISYNAKELRLLCPCAACVNELTGERMIKASFIPDDIHALSVHTVGRYALQIVWSDRHATGLYGFDYLRKIAAAQVR